MRYSDLSLPMDDAARLSRARQMGFNTDVIVYHGSRADAFSAFSKDHLGTYTGSASAKLGFYFGSSRQNSFSYSGGDPENTKFKNLEGLKDIQQAIVTRCAEEGIPRSFSMGLSSGTAIPRYSQINDKDKTVDEIKSALIQLSNEQLKHGLESSAEYVKNYVAGVYKPKRDYSSPKFVADQVRMMRRQHEITLNIIKSWQNKLEVKDWGWLGAFYLRMTNPYTVDQDHGRRQRSFVDIVDEARKAGHDGVIILNTFDPKPTDVYVVFEPEQIRSVNATFDPSKNNSPNFMD